MEDIKQYKNELTTAYTALPENVREDLREFYSKSHDVLVIGEITRNARKDAEDVMHYADRRGYGYGEVRFNLNEAVEYFAEDVPQLEKQYKRLLHAYFEFLIESKNI